MNKAAKVIRVLTVAPVMAMVMLLTLYLRNPLLFGRRVNLALSILFLVVFPLLAYPLQPLLKKYRGKGREGQRTLAIDFAVSGYIGGSLSAILLRAPKSLWIIYLSYLLSGILVMLTNKLFHFRASGHACGVAGPFAILVYFEQPFGFYGIPVLALVFLSSLQLKRHTILQLICGAVIPIVALGIVIPQVLQL